MSRKLPELSLSVQYACNAPVLPSRTQVRCWIRAACSQPAAVTVRFVDTDEGQALNRDYRGKDYATNVLSFPYESLPVTGDLVVCAPVVAVEAAERGLAAEAHFAHLIVHGMLHLQGHDHLTPDAAEAMEGLETTILAGLGIADPY
jgi:probable rRNA maturation factor